MLKPVDFVSPVESLIPGAQGRILAALARTTAEINLRTLADLAGVSPAQASRVLSRLVDLGVVHRREAPPSALFQLARGNIAARLVTGLAALREATLGELATLAQDLTPQAVNVTLFGSFARGQARTGSDIDVLVVRGVRTPEDDEEWSELLGTFMDRARERTGNPVNIVEVGESEVGRLLRSRRPVWRDLLADGVKVAGEPLESLRSRRSA